MRLAGMAPDPWQTEVLGYRGKRILLNCSRQTGKSTVAAAAAVGTLTQKSGGQVMMTAPSQRQSNELFRAATSLVQAAGLELNLDALSKTHIELADGGRIMAVPGSERTLRGVPALDLLIVDEAARVNDELMTAIRPMLATTGGRMMALSTPDGQRGWFFETAREAKAGLGRWRYWEIPVTECPRITEEFLQEELEEMGAAKFEQEYHCKFLLGERQVFSLRSIDAVAAQEHEKVGWDL